MWRCDPTLATLVFDITMQKVTKKPYERAQGDNRAHDARSADFMEVGHACPGRANFKPAAGGEANYIGQLQ